MRFRIGSLSEFFLPLRLAMAGRQGLDDVASDLGSRWGITPTTSSMAVPSASAAAAQGAHSSSFVCGGQSNFGRLPIYSGSRRRGA